MQRKYFAVCLILWYKYLFISNSFFKFVIQKQNKMKTITKIKVWKSEKTNEVRIYVDFEGCKEQGCYYKDGNTYQAKGTLQNMNEEDKQNAIALCEKAIGKRAWVTLYENQIDNLNKFGKTTAPVQKKEYPVTYSRFDRNMDEYERDKAKGFPVFLPDYMD